MIGHRVVLRPRSFIETGDLTMALMREHTRAFVSLLPWVLVPAVMAYLLYALKGWSADLAVGLEVALTSLTTGVYTLLCGDLMLQPKVDLRNVQGRFLRRLIPYSIARLFGWIVTYILAGLSYRFAVFTPECALLERGSIGSSLSRSGSLLRITPGRATAYGLTVIGMLAMGALGAELFHTALRELFGLRVNGLLTDTDHLTWASFLGIALVQPYLAAMRFLLYVDCRTRREGWDLQVQFGALVTAAASPLRRHSSPSEAA